MENQQTINPNQVSPEGLSSDGASPKSRKPKWLGKILGLLKAILAKLNVVGQFLLRLAKKFWAVSFAVKSKKVRLAWPVLAVAVVLIVVGALTDGGGEPQETVKSLVYDYEVNLPAGFTEQQDVLGNVTLTQQSSEGEGGNCTVHIIDPRNIADETSLEIWVRTYLGQQDERFDYTMDQVEMDGADEVIKIHAKNNAPKGQDWYFARMDGKVLIIKSWKHRAGTGDCEKFVREIIH